MGRTETMGSHLHGGRVVHHGCHGFAPPPPAPGAPAPPIPLSPREIWGHGNRGKPQKMQRNIERYEKC